MGTPCYVEAGLKDIDRYTYWIMPIYPVAQAVWYRLFSFSLASMRALSIFCGLLGLLAWTLFFRRLTGDDVGALLFMALMACDYINQSDIGVGRPDAMAFAFQAGAFAAYLHWRERNLRLAILLSQTLVVASGLTHPNGGMLSFLGALWLVLYFDRRRIRPAHVAIAAIPYVAGAIGWGAYIAQDPSAFVAQYGYQIATRSQILTAPWLAVRDELVRRYLTNMGLGGHSPGSYGPHYLKAVIFVAYAVSVAGLLAVPSLRQNRASRVLPRSLRTAPASFAAVRDRSPPICHAPGPAHRSSAGSRGSLPRFRPLVVERHLKIEIQESSGSNEGWLRAANQCLDLGTRRPVHRRIRGRTHHHAGAFQGRDIVQKLQRLGRGPAQGIVQFAFVHHRLQPRAGGAENGVTQRQGPVTSGLHILEA